MLSRPLLVVVSVRGFRKIKEPHSRFKFASKRVSGLARTRTLACPRLQAYDERGILIADCMKIQLRQISTSSAEATLRGHHVRIDRPVDKGGTDAGPMGGELFLAAIGGCFMSNLLAAVRAREAMVSDVRMEVIGTLANAPARFIAVELYVAADCADPEQLERLVDIADRGCVMMNTLRGKLDVRVQIGVPA